MAGAEVGTSCLAAIGGGGIGGPVAAAKFHLCLCHLFLVCSTRSS